MAAAAGIKTLANGDSRSYNPAMQKRLLRFGRASTGNLMRDNPRHNVAHVHAMHIYGANAVYSLIPKNACSTMRVSIAIDNGAIPDAGHIEWIHSNNDTFRPPLRDLLQADYTFVVLRCPFARLASCFIDKFTQHSAPLQKYREVIAKSPRWNKPGEPISFKSFCLSLTDEAIRSIDIHWRPQGDFLVYDDYDDYFCVERFGEAVRVIEAKTAMKIVDARPLTQHGIDSIRLLPPGAPAGSVPLSVHRAMREKGEAFHPTSLFDDETIAAVRAAYADDLALFNARFPGSGLFERQRADGTP